MTTRLIIALILFSAALAMAAGPLPGRQYYGWPDAPNLKPNDRILVYQNNSGSRNITGAKLKEQINSQPVIKGPFGNYSSVSRSGSNSQRDYLHDVYWNQTQIYFDGAKMVIRQVVIP